MDSNDRRAETGREGLTRRAVLTTATVAAGALAGPAGAAAETAHGGDFGQPFVEFYMPPGVLTLEQRSDIVAAFTDVVLAEIAMVIAVIFRIAAAIRYAVIAGTLAK